MSSNKGGIIKWMLNSEETTSSPLYSEAVIPVGVETIVPDKQSKFYAGSETIIDERKYIILQGIDVVILDGLSIMFSPFTNYSVGRNADSNKCTLLNKDICYDNRNECIYTRVDMLVDGFINLFKCIMKERVNCSTIYIVFDKPWSVPQCKREIQAKRSKDSRSKWKTDFSQGFSFTPDTIVGSGPEGTFDYMTVMYHREYRNMLATAVCKRLSGRLERVDISNDTRDYAIIIDYNPLTRSYLSDVEMFITKKPHVIKRESSTYESNFDANLIWSVLSTGTGEGDMSIVQAVKLLVTSIRPNPVAKTYGDKLNIEVVGNDSDNFLNLFVTVYKLGRMSNTFELYYRQIGGSSVHSLYDMKKTKDLLVETLAPVVGYDSKSNKPIEQHIEKRAVEMAVICEIASGSDYVSKIKGVGFKKMLNFYSNAMKFLLNKNNKRQHEANAFLFCMDHDRDIYVPDFEEWMKLIYCLVDGKTYETTVNKSVKIEIVKIGINELSAYQSDVKSFEDKLCAMLTSAFLDIASKMKHLSMNLISLISDMAKKYNEVTSSSIEESTDEYGLLTISGISFIVSFWRTVRGYNNESKDTFSFLNSPKNVDSLLKALNSFIKGGKKNVDSVHNIITIIHNGVKYIINKTGLVPRIVTMMERSTDLQTHCDNEMLSEVISHIIDMTFTISPTTFKFSADPVNYDIDVETSEWSEYSEFITYDKLIKISGVINIELSNTVKETIIAATKSCITTFMKSHDVNRIGSNMMLWANSYIARVWWNILYTMMGDSMRFNQPYLNHMLSLHNVDGTLISSKNDVNDWGFYNNYYNNSLLANQQIEHVDLDSQMKLYIAIVRKLIPDSMEIINAYIKKNNLDTVLPLHLPVITTYNDFEVFTDLVEKKQSDEKVKHVDLLAGFSENAKGEEHFVSRLRKRIIAEFPYLSTVRFTQDEKHDIKINLDNIVRIIRELGKDSSKNPALTLSIGTVNFVLKDIPILDDHIESFDELMDYLTFALFGYIDNSKYGGELNKSYSFPTFTKKEIETLITSLDFAFGVSWMESSLDMISSLFHQFLSARSCFNYYLDAYSDNWIQSFLNVITKIDHAREHAKWFDNAKSQFKFKANNKFDDVIKHIEMIDVSNNFIVMCNTLMSFMDFVILSSGNGAYDYICYVDPFDDNVVEIKEKDNIDKVINNYEVELPLNTYTDEWKRFQFFNTTQINSFMDCVNARYDVSIDKNSGDLYDRIVFKHVGDITLQGNEYKYSISLKYSDNSELYKTIREFITYKENVSIEKLRFILDYFAASFWLTNRQQLNRNISVYRYVEKFIKLFCGVDSGSNDSLKPRYVSNFKSWVITLHKMFQLKELSGSNEEFPLYSSIINKITPERNEYIVMTSQKMTNQWSFTQSNNIEYYLKNGKSISAIESNPTSNSKAVSVDDVKFCFGISNDPQDETLETFMLPVNIMPTQQEVVFKGGSKMNIEYLDWYELNVRLIPLNNSWIFPNIDGIKYIIGTKSMNQALAKNMPPQKTTSSNIMTPKKSVASQMNFSPNKKTVKDVELLLNPDIQSGGSEQMSMILLLGITVDRKTIKGISVIDYLSYLVGIASKGMILYSTNSAEEIPLQIGFNYQVNKLSKMIYKTKKPRKQIIDGVKKLIEANVIDWPTYESFRVNVKDMFDIKDYTTDIYDSVQKYVVVIMGKLQRIYTKMMNIEDYNVNLMYDIYKSKLEAIVGELTVCFKRSIMKRSKKIFFMNEKDDNNDLIDIIHSYLTEPFSTMDNITDVIWNNMLSYASMNDKFEVLTNSTMQKRGLLIDSSDEIASRLDEIRKTLMSKPGIDKKVMDDTISYIQSGYFYRTNTEDDLEELPESIRAMFEDPQTVIVMRREFEDKISQQREEAKRLWRSLKQRSSIPALQELKHFEEEVEVGNFIAERLIDSVDPDNFMFSPDLYDELYNFLLNKKEERKQGQRKGLSDVPQEKKSRKEQTITKERNYARTINSILSKKELNLELLFDLNVRTGFELTKSYKLSTDNKLGKKVVPVGYSVIQSILTILRIFETNKLPVKSMMPLLSIPDIREQFKLSPKLKNGKSIISVLENELFTQDYIKIGSHIVELIGIEIKFHIVSVQNARTVNLTYQKGKKIKIDDDPKLEYEYKDYHVDILLLERLSNLDKSIVSVAEPLIPKNVAE